jgi:hypothetical protein
VKIGAHDLLNQSGTGTADTLPHVHICMEFDHRLKDFELFYVSLHNLNMAEELLTSLNDTPNIAECRILDAFIRENSKQYQFSDPEFLEIIPSILLNRLTIHEFALSKDFYSYILKLLQCIRILSRDATLHEAFDDIEKLAILLTKYADDYFFDTKAPFIAEMLIELTSILRRISPDRLLDFGIPRVLSILLGS